MTKAETIAGVYTHTSNLVKNKQAKKLALLNILKTRSKHFYVYLLSFLLWSKCERGITIHLKLEFAF